MQVRKDCWVREETRGGNGHRYLSYLFDKRLGRVSIGLLGGTYGWFFLARLGPFDSVEEAKRAVEERVFEMVRNLVDWGAA